MPPKSKPETKSEPKKAAATRSAIADVVAREYTIHLHKRVCIFYPSRLEKQRPQHRIYERASNLFAMND